MPDLPRTAGGTPTLGLNAAIHEQFDPNQPSSSRDAPYSQSGKGKGKGKGKSKGWLADDQCMIDSAFQRGTSCVVYLSGMVKVSMMDYAWREPLP